MFTIGLIIRKLRWIIYYLRGWWRTPSPAERSGSKSSWNESSMSGRCLRCEEIIKTIFLKQTKIRECEMNEKPLMKWGGICAYVFVVLSIIWAVNLWISQGGIPSQMPTVSEWADMVSGGAHRTFIVLFGISFCFFVVVAYATYDYLRKTSYGLSRIGFGFATIFIISAFVMIGISAAGKNIALVRPSDFEIQLFVVMNLFGGIHTLVIWFWALFPFFWGLAFIKLEGNNKIIGVLFLATTVFAVLYYIFLRAGNIWIAEFSHLLGQITMIVSSFFLALVLTAESKKA